jgi:hypothetical protein
MPARPWLPVRKAKNTLTLSRDSICQAVKQSIGAKCPLAPPIPAKLSGAFEIVPVTTAPGP